MPTMAPPDIATDLSVLEALDFALSCEYPGRVPECDNEAEWIVWVSQSCHGAEPLVRQFCDPCLVFRRDHPGTSTCPQCGAVETASETFIRAERIKL